MTHCLSATTKQRLFKHAQSYNWKIEVLPKTRFENVLIIKKNNSIIPEIWVCSTYTKYKRAFSKFLMEYFRLDFEISKDYHVDHSLPKIRFKKLYLDYFIRLFLIDKNINCSYGATYEKMFFEKEFNQKPNGGFHISMITILKVLGYSIPKKRTDEIERKNWAYITSKKLEKEGLENWEWHYPFLYAIINDGYKDLNINEIMISKDYSTHIVRKYD